MTKTVLWHCPQIGSEVSVPTSQRDLAWTMTSKNVVTLNTTCSEGFWMPIVRSKSNGSKWISFKEAAKDLEVSFLPWEWSQPNGYPIQVNQSHISCSRVQVGFKNGRVIYLSEDSNHMSYRIYPWFDGQRQQK